MRPLRGMLGKLIVFARRRYIAPDLYDVLPGQEIADVPAIGKVIEPGQPICTVFVQGADVAACVDRLHEAAEKVYTHRIKT